jgi:hypothetical protein
MQAILMQHPELAPAMVTAQGVDEQKHAQTAAMKKIARRLLSTRYGLCHRPANAQEPRWWEFYVTIAPIAAPRCRR